MEAARRGQLTSAARQVIVVRNPMAGAVSTAGPVDDFLRELQRCRLEPRLITAANQLVDEVQRGLENGSLRAVVAAGGDGTAAFVANHTTRDTPLAVLPLGTENLLSRYLRVTSDPIALAQIILAGHTVQMDAGEIDVPHRPSRLFLLMLGCGFDAEVIRRLHEQRRGHITHLSYFKPIWRSMREYTYPEIQVTCQFQDETRPPRVLQAHWFFAFNTPSYAVGLPICPQANPVDGELDVVAFRGGSTWHGLGHFVSILARRHQQLANVDVCRVRSFRLESTAPVPFQVDGDPGGMLPIEVRVCPNRLRIVVPNAWSPQALTPS